VDELNLTMNRGNMLRIVKPLPTVEFDLASGQRDMPRAMSENHPPRRM
jgi:hypothetical protein